MKSIDFFTPGNAFSCLFLNFKKPFTLLELQEILAHKDDIDERSECGMTVLMEAAQLNQSIETIELLLEFGADFNATDKEGDSVLMHSKATPDILKFFLDKGADFLIKNKSGQTVLDLILKDIENYSYLSKTLDPMFLECATESLRLLTEHQRKTLSETVPEALSATPPILRL